MEENLQTYLNSACVLQKGIVDIISKLNNLELINFIINERISRKTMTTMD